MRLIYRHTIVNLTCSDIPDLHHDRLFRYRQRCAHLGEVGALGVPGVLRSLRGHVGVIFGGILGKRGEFLSVFQKSLQQDLYPEHFNIS